MIINARIISTKLGNSSAPVFDSSITLAIQGGNKVRFGGWRLDGKPTETSNGQGVYSLALSCWVTRILEVVGVSSWEDLPGQFVRIEIPDYETTQVRSLGHLMEDLWFRPDQDLETGIKNGHLQNLERPSPEDPFAS